jgi:hypothetical protein
MNCPSYNTTNLRGALAELKHAVQVNGLSDVDTRADYDELTGALDQAINEVQTLANRPEYECTGNWRTCYCPRCDDKRADYAEQRYEMQRDARLMA